MDVEQDMTRSVQPDDARAVDLGNEQPAIRQGRVAVGIAIRRGRMVTADAGSTPLPNDPLRAGDLQHATVADVRDDHVAVGQGIGVVRCVEEAGAAAEGVLMAVLPDDATGPDVDPDHYLVTLLVGHDRPAV